MSTFVARVYKSLELGRSSLGHSFFYQLEMGKKVIIPLDYQQNE